MKWRKKLTLGTSIGLGAAETYRMVATQEQKDRWEGLVNIHHGEVGIVCIVLGVLTRSPTILGIGIGLAIHDIRDALKWFKR